MRKIFLISLSLLAFASAAQAQGQAGSVFITTSSQTDQQVAPGQHSAASVAGDILESQVSHELLARFPCASLMTRSAAAQILGVERQRQLLGADDSDRLASLASALGAKYLISLSVTQTGGQMLLQASCLNGTTAKAIDREARPTNAADLTRDAQSLAEDFVARLGPLFSVTPESGKTYPVGTSFATTCSVSYRDHTRYQGTVTEANRWDESARAFYHGQDGDLQCSRRECMCATCTCSDPATIRLETPGRYRLVNKTDSLAYSDYHYRVIAEVTIAGSCKK
jgi:hypothetical protein